MRMKFLKNSMDSSTLKGMIISLLVAVLPERYNEGNDDKKTGESQPSGEGGAR